MKNEIMNKAGRLFGKTSLSIKKHSPEILMGLGIVGTVASTVMACKATTKATELVEYGKKEIEAIKHVAETRSDEYTEKDLQQALTISYAQTGLKLIRLYTPAIALGTLSITSILAGHHILKKRNIALAAAYTVVDRGFKNYRKNVVERFGEELDKELRYNIKAKEVETIVKDENGNEKVEKRIANVIDENQVNEYNMHSRFFDDSCPDFKKDAEANMMYLRMQQTYANEKLRLQGHLFLNEVYDLLGFPRTKAGQTLGWIYDPKNPKGDNYVDFGIYNGSERSRAFVNGYEKAILLDFNFDGPILEDMPYYNGR